MIDQERVSLFVDWFSKSMEIEDCDPALYMTNYFFDRFEYNTEQRLWLSWLYGTTYYFPTAYVMWNEFPDMELVGIERLTEWNNHNYKRLRYQTDTKWNKGHLPAQYQSYKEFVGERTQYEALTERFVGDEVKDFYTLWDTVNSFHKFGRYSSWFYIQTLKQCCELPVDVDSLWFHDYSGSRSHRNGMCYALGMDSWVDQKLNDKQIQMLESVAQDVLSEVKLKYPNADAFGMETCLCSFKKIFRNSKTRYIGYYLDRQAAEIRKVQNDGWDGVDFNPMWQAREESLDSRVLLEFVGDEKKLEFNEKLLYPWQRSSSVDLEQMFG